MHIIWEIVWIGALFGIAFGLVTLLKEWREDIAERGMEDAQEEHDPDDGSDGSESSDDQGRDDRSRRS